MTEVKANPYNTKTSNANENVPRGIVSADDGLATPQQPVAPQEAESIDTSVSEIPEVQPEPFKKVDYEKRYNDLRRHLQTKTDEFKVKEAELSQKISDGLPKYSPPRTPEELATFREEDPEAYATIEAIADLRSSERAQEVQDRLAAIEKREIQVKKEEAFSQLAKLQPDFEEIKATEAFHEWVPKQPQDIQDWLYNSFNANLASRAIDLFKQDVGWKKSDDKATTKQKPKSKVKKPSAADAVDVRAKSEPSLQEKKIWTTSEIDKLARHNVLELERVMPEIDIAYQEGRVIKG